MKRKAPTRRDRTVKEQDTQKLPFFSQDRTAAFFQSSGTDAFFQPPAKHGHGHAAGSTTTPSSTTPTPYYISFTHVAPPARPDHSQSNPGPSDNAANRAGFTRISHRPSLSIAWGRTLMPNAQGQIGIFVRSANVGFNVHTLTVAISSDYARGSCPYRVTYAHEYRHARNFLNIFRNHRPTMVQRAEGIPLPTAQAPRYVDPAQANATQEQIAAPLVQAIREVKGQITADMEADRDGMDSPSSYAHEYAQCPSSDW
ncbi:MAG: hypothetical protein F6K11_28435 [Leptolyngbya sp. SIO3F4]|nr:hypothetical protein [Leptolyngbya sp. SIO3F4]